MPNEELRPENERQRSPFHGLLGRLWRLLRHNWGWKLGCLVLAICLWGGLITQDATLLRSKVISGITVNVLNEDTLLRSGYIVVSGLEPEKLTGVRIKVDVPQKYYNQVSASNYNVRVDLSKIRSAGEQVLPVVATSSATYGTVTDISVSQVTVVVEEYVMRSKIPVRLETIGEAPAGFYGGAASVDPVYVAIAGPRSQVENVVRCVAQYDMAYLPAQNGTERTAVPFILYDRADQLVPQDDISVSTGGVLIDSITVEQTLFPINKVFVATAGLTAGTPEKGYEVKSISVEPAFVSIAFSYADTKRSEYIYPQDAIDLSGLKESTVVAVSLKRPSDTIYMSTDTVYVTVDIGPEGD